MSRTVTTSTLAASIAAQGEALTSIVGLLTTLVSQSGQYATPAPVAAAVTAEVTRPTIKVTKTVKRPTVTLKPAKVAKAADPAKAAAWALVKADREAISPMNKAFAKLGVTGDAWTTRWSNIDAINAAYATLTPAQQGACIDAVNRKIAAASK